MFFKSDYNDLMPPFPEHEDAAAEKKGVSCFFDLLGAQLRHTAEGESSVSMRLYSPCHHSSQPFCAQPGGGQDCAGTSQPAVSRYLGKPSGTNGSRAILPLC